MGKRHPLIINVIYDYDRNVSMEVAARCVGKSVTELCECIKEKIYNKRRFDNQQKAGEADESAM